MQILDILSVMYTGIGQNIRNTLDFGRFDE